MSHTLVTLLLALLIPLISAQFIQSPSNDSRLLRFVAQLNVSGCAIFVHDTGAPGGPHLAVEPLMCVTDSLSGVLPRYDPVTEQRYVIVPVMLTNDGLLTEVIWQMRHLLPKSVTFATVSDISVFTDASSVIEALGFDWAPEEATGILRFGCKERAKNCSVDHIASDLRAGNFEPLRAVLLTAAVKQADFSFSLLNYRLTIQNQTHFDSSFWGQTHLPICGKLIYSSYLIKVREDCAARVFQRADLPGHYLIEPLLCHSIINMSVQSVMYEYTRDMYYLKLDVLLQDEISLDALKRWLAYLSPLSVSFMPLWSAQIHVALALRGRFEIGGLMVSRDWSSGQVRVYCRSEKSCLNLRDEINERPFRLLRYFKWSLNCRIDSRCVHSSAAKRLMINFKPQAAYVDAKISVN